MKTNGAPKRRERAIEEALRKSEVRYRRLFETAKDGILILDANTGAIVDANPFLLDLLGYPFDGLIGKHLWDIGEFKDIAASKAAFTTLQDEEYLRYENLPLQTNSGEQRQVELVSNVYDVEGEKVIQCNIRDIRMRSKADEISRDRLAAVELANKDKDDVLAILSHELRGPLNVISCATDLLELGHDVTDKLDKTDVPPQFDRAAIGLIRRNLHTTVRLINELLDLTRMGKGTLRLNRERLDAHEAIRSAIRNAESQQQAVGVGIEFHLQARHSVIRADSGKFEQVLSNLIGNALKFTPKGGKVSVFTRNEESDALVIEVSDTGIGISSDALSRVFLPFAQADPSVRPRFGGLGLGLWICKTLVEAHGGTLKVESEGLGRGARFTARFKVDDSVAEVAR
jgi:PAS domain S-box-containing protein